LQLCISDDYWKPRVLPFVAHAALNNVHTRSWLSLFHHTIQAANDGAANWSRLEFRHKFFVDVSFKFAMAWEVGRPYVLSDVVKTSMVASGRMTAEEVSKKTEQSKVNTFLDDIPQHAYIPPSREMCCGFHVVSAYDLDCTLLHFVFRIIADNFSKDVGGLLRELILPRVPCPLARLDFSTIRADVVLHEGVPVCAAVFRILPHFRGPPAPNLLEVLFVATEKETRLLGVGTRMQQHIEEVGRVCGCAALYVETGPVSTAHFWEGYGFRPAETVGALDPYDFGYFDCRCLRFRDTQQHVKIFI
jgi:GNAT superfamily N-acetyltransferase